MCASPAASMSGPTMLKYDADSAPTPAATPHVDGTGLPVRFSVQVSVAPAGSVIENTVGLLLLGVPSWQLTQYLSKIFCTVAVPALGLNHGTPTTSVGLVGVGFWRS